MVLAFELAIAGVVPVISKYKEALLPDYLIM